MPAASTQRGARQNAVSSRGALITSHQYGTGRTAAPIDPWQAACADSQAVDPVPFPERVSAFPSSGKGTGSTARDCRLSAIPSSGSTTGSTTRDCRVSTLLCSRNIPDRLLAMRCAQRGARRNAISSRAILITGHEHGTGRPAAPIEPWQVAGTVRILGLWRESVQAPSRRRSIRCLSPSACLPFQARGKAPDRPP